MASKLIEETDFDLEVAIATDKKNKGVVADWLK